MSYFYIYRIFHPETNEFYIGRRKSKLPPLEDPYKGSSSSWYSQLSKSIIKEVLIKEILNDSYNSMEELAEAESNYIRENIQNPLCKNGYIPGSGFYCKNVSIETRVKISSSLLGNKNSLNNIPWNKDKFLSEEHKNKIKESILLTMTEERINQMSENKKGKEPWNKGKSLTDEHRKNLSKSKIEGMTDEIRKKISEGGMGRIPWNKGKKTIRRTKKQIEEDNLKKLNNA